MGTESNQPSTTAKRISHSTWQEWPVPADLDYPEAGSSTHELSASEPSTGLLGAAPVFFAITSLGVGMLVGSGGSAEYLLKQYRAESPITSPSTWESLWATLDQQRLSTDKSKEAAAPVYSAADLVAEIKATLGISVTDLATIAKVSRQTIYDWIGEGQVSPENYARLLELRRICARWQEMAKKPVGRLLHVTGADGASLFWLLGQDILDPTAIGQHLRALAVKAEQQAEQRRQQSSRITSLSEKDQYENVLAHAFPATDS